MPLAKIKAARGLFLFLASLLLTGCHYQFGRGELSQRYGTISVPYVKGDQKGELTNDIIKRLGTSGAFRYVSNGGDLIIT
jgi:outer membrane biogenesis lipoprotein LolB